MGLFSSNKNVSHSKKKAQNPKAHAISSNPGESAHKSMLANSKPLIRPYTYPYNPLNPAKDEFRVLQIRPGRGKEPLICILLHASLAKPTLRYESISYCWGSCSAEEIITIDGIEVTVRCSAASVLRRMRLSDIGRLVWIDAICINQESPSEKMHQVALMGQIYSKTIRNLIWLGESVGSMDEVKAALDDVLRNAGSATDNLRNFWQTLYPDRVQAANGTLLNRNINLAPLVKLFSVDWFSRVWIVQEAVLAPRNVCYLGSAEFRLEDVLRVAMWLSYNRLLVPNFLKEVSGLKRACNLWLFVDTKLAPVREVQIRRQNLHWLYSMTREFEAKEPQDKIYALLGMFDDSMLKIPLPFMPDYEKPILEVFRDVTRYMIRNSANLGILEHNMAMRTRPGTQCPSWVVDFSRDRIQDREIRQFAIFSADNGERLNMMPPAKSGNRLILGGIKSDVVRLCSQRFSRDNVDGYLRSAQKIVSNSHLAHSCYSHEAMVTTLIAGRNSADMPVTGEDVGDFATLVQYLKRHKKNPPTRPDLNVLGAAKLDRETFQASRYWSALEVISTGRCFFVSREGRIGIGPARMKEKDVICILYGARTPIVLRPHGQVFEFVGQCYIHGMMEGEAVQQHRATGGRDDILIIV